MRTSKTLALCAILTACSRDEAESEFRSIEPVCVEESAPAEVWSCDEPLVIDCNDDAVPEEIYVQLEAGQCADAELAPIEGAFGPGNYDIVVIDDVTDAPVCSTELVVTDALAPLVEGATIQMWPPNHKLHDFALADCIVSVDDCDPEWTARLDWIASDEPVNDNGDGNSEPDVVIGDGGAFSVRSERQGGSNGRVYTVGFTVTDGSGNATPAECHVIVDHDQGSKGAGIDDGEAYRVDA